MLIYDATLYTAKPATTPFQPIIVSGDCFAQPTSAGGRVCDNAVLEGLVAEAQQKGCPLILDFEWENTDQLSAALMLARFYGGPKLKLGAYGFSPDATGPGAQQALQYPWSAKTWQNAMQLTDGVVDLCDFVMPSCYVGDNNGDPATWGQTVTLALIAARLRWPHKPLIPFIWPYSANTNPPTYATHDQFYGVMQTVQNLADGCVIWSNPGDAWNPAADWLATATHFAGEK